MVRLELGKTKLRLALAVVGVFTLLQSAPASALYTDLGSDGSDGALNVTVDTVVALPIDGVLHYTTVTIAAGATLSFSYTETHPHGVVMLASGLVTIDGTIDIRGQNGSATAGGAPGPGGSYGAPPTFENNAISTHEPRDRGGQLHGLRSFGGSGGRGFSPGSRICTTLGGGGGGGGGGLVILANEEIRGSGLIDADGGQASSLASVPSGCRTTSAAAGAAGYVRLVAPTLGIGGLSIAARSVRTDAVEHAVRPTLLDAYDDYGRRAPSTLTPGDRLDAWPSQPLPTATVTSINGQASSPGDAITIPVDSSDPPIPVEVRVQGCTAEEMVVGLRYSARNNWGARGYTLTVTRPQASETVIFSVPRTIFSPDRRTGSMDAYVHCGVATTP